MRRVLQRSTLLLLCFFGTEQGLAQAPQCRGDYVCIVEAQTVAQPVEPSVTAKDVNLAAPERCPEASVDVTAASPDQRRLACLAAGDALQLLGRCGISVRRPLQVEIMSEVRHPFGGRSSGSLTQAGQEFSSRRKRTFQLW